MKISELTRIIEQKIPVEWALPGDPVGLQIGDPDRRVERIAVALEVTTPVLKKAARKRAELLLVHHPLIFHPLKKLLSTDPVQRLVRELVRKDMALYAAHTNLDLHPQGMAGVWAKRIGCVRAGPVSAKPQAGHLKIVTFVPRDHADRIREAMAKAGAGQIGNYDFCSFTSEGTGTYRGSEGTTPFIGSAGVLEREEELRLEMVLPTNRSQAVVDALRAIHPYEEPAYDLYCLHDLRGLNQALWTAELDEKLTWSEFEERVRQSLPPQVNITNVRPRPRRRIKRIAVSTGSGNSLLPMVRAVDPDVYLTGEIEYHFLWEAEENGLNVMVTGHGHSESFFAETIMGILQTDVEGITWLPI